jgi:hypothetical protein
MSLKILKNIIALNFPLHYFLNRWKTHKVVYHPLSFSLENYSHRILSEDHRVPILSTKLNITKNVKELYKE